MSEEFEKCWHRDPSACKCAEKNTIRRLGAEIERLNAELSRRLLTPAPNREAEPGGLSEAWKPTPHPADPNRCHHAVSVVDDCYLCENECEADRRSRRLLTPAPNREAELKVIEAAKIYTRPENARLIGTYAALCHAVASLAQSEMKGPAGQEPVK